MRYAWNWPHLTLKLASLNQVQSAPIFIVAAQAVEETVAAPENTPYRVAFEKLRT